MVHVMWREYQDFPNWRNVGVRCGGFKAMIIDVQLHITKQNSNVEG